MAGGWHDLFIEPVTPAPGEVEPLVVGPVRDAQDPSNGDGSFVAPAGPLPPIQWERQGAVVKGVWLEDSCAVWFPCWASDGREGASPEVLTEVRLSIKKFLGSDEGLSAGPVFAHTGRQCVLSMAFTWGGTDGLLVQDVAQALWVLGEVLPKITYTPVEIMRHMPADLRGPFTNQPVLLELEWHPTSRVRIDHDAPPRSE